MPLSCRMCFVKKLVGDAGRRLKNSPVAITFSIDSSEVDSTMHRPAENGFVTPVYNLGYSRSRHAKF